MYKISARSKVVCIPDRQFEVKCSELENGPTRILLFRGPKIVLHYAISGSRNTPISASQRRPKLTSSPDDFGTFPASFRGPEINLKYTQVRRRRYFGTIDLCISGARNIQLPPTHLLLNRCIYFSVKRCSRWETTFRGPEIEPVQSVGAIGGSGAVGGVGAISGPLTSSFRGPEMCPDPHL